MNTDSGETRSIWMDEDVPQFAPLAGDARVDVCIVGGGIAGLTTAYCLAPERSVLVLEDGAIGGGETGRTTAHLSNALDDGYDVLERVHGREGARLAAQSHGAAIDFIEATVNRERIECAFMRLDGYLISARKEHSKALERELEAARRAGISGVTLTSETPVTGFARVPSLKFPRQGQFHPLAYLGGLARAIVTAGGRICTLTRVRSVEDGAPCRVITTDGHTVSATALVIATNSPISDRVALHTKQAAYRTYAIAIEISADEVPTALYWDTEDPYHYVRVHHMSDGRAALIAGGEDHKTGQADDAHERFARLETWTREHFNVRGSLLYRWSGQIQEPVDHLAFIGRDIGKQHVYIVTGDSGHGMTHGTIGGMLIADLVAGRVNPWTSLYAPDRKSARAARTYARENLNVAKQFVTHLTQGDVPEIADIERGCGAIVRHGASKLAVYRADDDSIHAHSAVCTHVGCVVRWNDLEKSWDCPCHGSRFDVNGEVINGPAHEPLAAVVLEDEVPHARVPSSGERPGQRDRPRG